MVKKNKIGNESLDESRIEGVEDQPIKTYSELLINLQPFANPLASKKLTKKIYKIVRKASNVKNLSRGIRDVNKRLRKGDKGIVVMAGDTYPVDVISHLPIVCEDADIPYCYVPSKEHLGLASGSNRQACAMLVKPHQDYNDLYTEVHELVKTLPPPL